MYQAYYILRGHDPVPVEHDEWAAWMEPERHGDIRHRIVAKSAWGDAAGKELVMVSTMFLGINHGWDGTLMLFETMIFVTDKSSPPAVLDQAQWRYATWAEAEEGHREAVKLVEHFLNREANGGDDDSG